MYRESLKQLVSWKKDQYRKPLLVRGARQVGKTYLIEEFGREHFKQNFIKFDFEARPDLRKIFSGSLEPKAIVPQLELFAGQIIDDSRSLIFFDEIQACPLALTALKYFFEQRPNLAVIAAGSLLEFAMQEVSFPVGRVRTLNIYPLTFEEFLTATGKEQLAKLLDGPPRTLSPAEHELMLTEYKQFLLIGGLPEAVKIYAETGSALQAVVAQKDLVRMYEVDFGKYAGRADLECLRQVLHSVPQRITKQIKYAHLTTDFSIPTIKNAVRLLSMAQIIHKVPNTNPHGLPLGASASAKVFKLILLDLSLLHALCNLEPQQEIQSAQLLDAYRGALAEQAVGQALLQQTGGGIFTWYRPISGSQAEVDYVVEKGGQIIPIEVKSGALSRLKSLHQFLKDYPLSTAAYAISTAPYAKHESKHITILPIYYASSFLRWI